MFENPTACSVTLSKMVGKLLRRQGHSACEDNVNVHKFNINTGEAAIAVRKLMKCKKIAF